MFFSQFVRRELSRGGAGGAGGGAAAGVAEANTHSCVSVAHWAFKATVCVPN